MKGNSTIIHSFIARGQRQKGQMINDLPYGQSNFIVAQNELYLLVFALADFAIYMQRQNWAKS